MIRCAIPAIPLPHLQHVPLHIGPRGQDARVSLDDLKGLCEKKPMENPMEIIWKSHGNHMEIINQAYLNISAMIYFSTRLNHLNLLKKIRV